MDDAVSGHGGAIYSLSRASQLENTVLTLVRCRFENNRAKGDGGAAALSDNTLADIRQSLFIANQAGCHGGALAVTGQSSIKAESNTYDRNTAVIGDNDIYDD